MSTPQHRADPFLDPGSDPREGGPRLGDERTTLNEFLRCQRLTLQLKCDGLDAGQLARRAVEPSTMSLLSLVRHMAEVERGWFRRRFAGLDVPKRYQTEADPDADFTRAVADPAVVGEAWTAWREEVVFAEQFAEGSRTRNPLRNGSSGSARPSLSPAPQNTWQPAFGASATAARTSADLPMPGSPSLSTEPPRPRAHLSYELRSVVISLSRPTSTSAAVTAGMRQTVLPEYLLNNRANLLH